MFATFRSLDVRRGVLAVVVVGSIAGCGPISHTETAERRGTQAARSTLADINLFTVQDYRMSDPLMSLAGDEDFDAHALDAQARSWHERLGRAVAASIHDQVGVVERDDSYLLGRTTFQYNHALLVALRATGDLAFLDALDEVAQAMRGQLDDGWCGRVGSEVYVNVRYGTVRARDGFVNFRERFGEGIHNCRDTGDLNEALVHGHLALVMYAYHVNRNNASPNGIDYGERADFWLDYLRNHFEAKWRRRSNTAWPDMDFIDLKFCHTYHQMLMYFTYVGLRLRSEGNPASEAYLQQAMRLTDGMFNVPYQSGRQPGGFIDVDTPLGAAVVYSFGAPGSDDVSDTHLEACPVTYARYMLTSVLNLRLDAVDGWNDDIMQRIATGLAHFVVDTDPLDSRSDPFAAGVSGSRSVVTLPPTAYRDRISIDRFAMTPFAAWSAWDDSGTLRRVSREVYETIETDPGNPREVHLPAGMLLADTLEHHRHRR